MWSGLTWANATILLTGENGSLQQNGASFKKFAPCENAVFCSNQENPGFCGFSPTPAAGPAFPCALPMPLVLGSSVVGDIAPL